MKKLALVVDSSTNIKNNEFEDVYVVPMILTKEVNGVVKTFRDEIDINSKQMLQDMMSGSVYKTASPLLGECSTLLDKLSSSYENVFVLSLHRKVSSTYSQ
jgi:fatty acid-binding protein DegV